MMKTLGVCPPIRLLILLLLLGGFSVPAAAQGTDTKPPAPLQLPAALDKAAPENVDDLRAIEGHVQKVLDKVMPAVVGIRLGGSSGSGVLITADGTILTAGHVSGTPHKDAIAILPDGKFLKAKTLGRNSGIDSGMMKIADKGPFPFLEMGKSSELKVGQWVLAVGHPGGFRSNRTPVVRLGRILAISPIGILTDCTLVGGDSGGPLFDMQGRVIGIHSRIGGTRIIENIHVPIDLYRRTLERLARGDSWGGKLESPVFVRSAGGDVVFEKKDKLTAEDPRDKAFTDSHCKVYPLRVQAGRTYTLDLLSDDKSGKKLATYLRLEGADGKEVARDDDGVGFPHSRVVFKAVKDGDYRIIATSFEPHQTGAFTLKVYGTESPDAFVQGKVDVLKTLKLPAPAVASLVDRFNKVKVPLFINAVLLDEHSNPMPNKEIVVQWDSGKEIVKSNAQGVVRWPLVKTKSKKLNLELGQGIRAMLALTDPEGISIGISAKVDPTVEKVKSAGGTVIRTVDGKLSSSDPFDASRKKCHQQTVEVTLQAGKTYTLDLVSEDFDAYLRLEDEKKTKLAEDDDGAGNMNSRIVFTATKSGTYRVVITTCDPGQMGTYQLTVRETDAAPMNAAPPEKK